MRQPDGAVLRVLQQLQVLGQTLDHAHAELKDGMGLNATDLATLRLLIVRDQRGRLTTPKEVAAHLEITTASATALIDRLVAAGHLRREPHPWDRRSRVLVLTEHARREFFAHFSGHLAAMRTVAERFDHTQLGTIDAFLTGLNTALGGPEAAEPPARPGQPPGAADDAEHPRTDPEETP
ncbi:MarR family winged helix-turn-helix transcriptional regulator [Rothia kristinae]|uniref:MarR family winged helix-turn-helix transcriptional regulator n=1 Tax=Rothia kristinae TaxID=37923 RepID=UPI0020B7F929|nr:MarR family transcriptional regulator [Rothia kristinae]WGH09085.1 MarR family transcriptional regulator [Rothia kristinae]